MKKQDEARTMAGDAMIEELNTTKVVNNSVTAKYLGENVTKTLSAKEKLEKIREEQEANERRVGNFIIKTANETLRDAENISDPVSLYKNVWNEGELSVLFARSNVGKSILAVQIANEIAEQKKEKVLYIDFELNMKQFQMRYKSAETGRMYKFSDLFLRPEIDYSDATSDVDYIADIEAMCIHTGAKIVIVDNITWIASHLEKGQEAADLMMKLKVLKETQELSMLVIAHTPKRSQFATVELEDLGGSSMLGNFADSIFALGRMAEQENGRYLKQVKVRYGERIYHGGNVLTGDLIQDDYGYTHIRWAGVGNEKDLVTLHDKEKIKSEVIRMRKEGKKTREIAHLLPISKSQAANIIKENGGNNEQ